MDNNAINKWLDDLARYFETRDRHGEDRAHWANVYNAENARKIKAALAASEAENERLSMELAALNDEGALHAAYISGQIDAKAEVARLLDQVYVPGVMRCAKCKFRLHRITLYMGDGSVGAGDNKTEPCPNGCGPLWSCTWKDEATENLSICETQVAEVARLKAEVAAIIAWLRNPAGKGTEDRVDAGADFADAIEAGRHMSARAALTGETDAPALRARKEGDGA